MIEGMVGSTVRIGVLFFFVLNAGACAGLLKTQSGPKQPRIAVLEIEGAESPRARELVLEMVAADEYEVVGPRAYESTAHRRGAAGRSDADITAVAKSLKLSAVVHGKLVKLKGPRRRLVVVIRDGMSGAVADRVAVVIRRGKLRERQRRKLSTRLYLALDEIVVSREMMLAQQEEEEAERKRAEEKARKEAEAKARAEEEKRREKERKQAEARARAEEEKKQREERERAEQKAIAEKAERERERKEREKRERKEAQEAKKSGDEADEEPSEPLDLETDDRGQVIDDEMPDVLER